MTLNEARELKVGDKIREKGRFNAPVETVEHTEESARKGREVMYIYTGANTYRNAQVNRVKSGK